MTTVQESIAQAQAETARLTALLKLFPDLSQEQNRWRRMFECSGRVNGTATDYEIAYTCGCCPDPGVVVRLYVETPHGRVYGVPHQVEVGQRIDGVDYPHPSWKQTLRSCGARDAILEKLQGHFSELRLLERQEGEPDDGK